MSRYLLWRALQLLPMLWGVLTFAFILIHLAPGGPIVALSGEFSTADYQRRMEALYGLDRPLLEQYGRYLLNVLRGELGESYYFKQPVLTVVIERLPATLALVVPSIFLSSVLGIWLGVITARQPHALRNLNLTAAVLAVYAVPTFWLAQLLVLIFAFYLGWFPIQGLRNVRSEFEGLRLWVDIAHHMALPVITLTLHQLALTTVLMRARMQEEMRQPYIRTALAKGLSLPMAQRRHGLRNALLPVVTIIGGRVGFVFAGAVLIEIIFAWPGLGRLLVSASLNRDYPLILGIFLCVSVATLVANLLTDIVYGIIDPRIRQGQAPHA